MKVTTFVRPSGLEIGLAVADPREILTGREFEYKTNKAVSSEDLFTEEDSVSRAEELPLPVHFLGIQEVCCSRRT